MTWKIQQTQYFNFLSIHYIRDASIIVKLIQFQLQDNISNNTNQIKNPARESQAIIMANKFMLIS